MSHPELGPDARDLLTELHAVGARYIVVGAHAMAVHGVSRATADLDLLVEASAENAPRVYEAMVRFGAPLRAHGVTVEALAREGLVYQIGLPPYRIDVLTQITGVPFERAWSGRVYSQVDGLRVPFLGLDDQLVNKRATGRTKDLADVEALIARRDALT